MNKKKNGHYTTVQLFCKFDRRYGSDNHVAAKMVNTGLGVLSQGKGGSELNNATSGASTNQNNYTNLECF